MTRHLRGRMNILVGILWQNNYRFKGEIQLISLTFGLMAVKFKTFQN